MISRLQKLYPNSLLNPKKKSAETLNNYYLVKTTNNQLYISLEKLEPKEIELLNLLTNKKPHNYQQNNSWKNLLFHQILNESISIKEIRLVYLHSKHLKKEDFQIWKKTLMDSLSEIVEVISVKRDFTLVILNNKKYESKTLYSFSEVIQSLDQDFNLLTQGMIGQAVNVNRRTAEVYKYEENLFHKIIKEDKVNGIVMLSNLLINRIGIEFKQTLPRFPKLFNYTTEVNEVRSMIYHLFKHQGNLSRTANALYIHRNTLSYRINQFYEKTGFDLTYFPDLIICYLLLD